MRGMSCWLAAVVLLAGPGGGAVLAADDGRGAPPDFAVVVDPAGAGGGALEPAAATKPSAAGAQASRPAAGGAAAETGRLERVKAAFADFCAGWVEKLRERERHNLSKVKWEAGPDGAVVAEYVGYDTDHVGPQTVEHADTVPIGKLVYLELKLRRAGKSKEEALARDPEIVERTEVTEIFRYDRTGWVY